MLKSIPKSRLIITALAIFLLIITGSLAQADPTPVVACTDCGGLSPGHGWCHGICNGNVCQGYCSPYAYGQAKSEKGCFAKSTAEQAKSVKSACAKSIKEQAPSEKGACVKSMKAPASKSCKAQPYTNYVAQCVFIHASGAHECPGSGTTPAEARTAAEDYCISQYGPVTGYGGCTITP